MLIDVKHRVKDEEIKQLMAYSVFPDPEKVERDLHDYDTNHHLELFAYEENEAIIGIIGIQTEHQTIEIRHLAIKPEYRGMGYGRGLLLELIALKQPEKIMAQTDEEAVDFYRNVGFSIISIGENDSGVERFKCEFTTNETDDE